MVYELFSKLIHDLMPVLIFFMWMTYTVLSCKLVTSFSTFSIFILSGKKMVSHYEVHVVFQHIEHQLQKNIFHHFLHIIFYELFIKLRSIIDPFKFIYWELLQHLLNIWIIYIPIFKIWGSFIINFNIFIISFCISMNCVTYPFSNSCFNH